MDLGLLISCPHRCLRSAFYTYSLDYFLPLQVSTLKAHRLVPRGKYESSPEYIASIKWKSKGWAKAWIIFDMEADII
ncbi:hypothetical protein RND71_021302 [Anisodus tanguticus]|uniref:Uncharacterized protein n=1 Tax=Anisodus tanguticus TaxID=243964 RepID=A0AAE1RXV2_9SOLA|nr:hypothetical protein RND71_021302 [Anisodus tanguticus]